ncbi:hypothetical protein CGMCC3_g17188 [Colletotrichum fructicola]|uniref:DUF3295 domain-containing protein n=2 Tax=Colletotrichum fructicola (strain Nara gc5) TaxID=1213859 RepID=A0A7J6IDA8_COLFN|nr:uncharacterized protein CGMCC3_g17188 [Colletotrichum fructicola]KAE9566648.1 hypothetical protein CGMCC3_g17188 [Colletotrichum fructicola]KAF4417693.1 Uncharacterized protein CFRS1_v015152 [Colletotrichum fructicola]KAF4474001.1 hypothetical protein CGGC5_v017006 [Colletotrichum fructicola Nara gc5]KAF4881008.1 hypothetical protein CGCFRS4_v015987 [Colletotrichum fructicola]
MPRPLDIYSNVNPDAFGEIESVDPHNIHTMLMQPPHLSRSVESNSEDETPGIQLNDGPSQTRPLVRTENSTSYGNEDFFHSSQETTTPHMPPKKMPATALESLSNNHPTSVTPVSSPEQENSPDAPHPGNKSHNPTDGSFSSSQASASRAASEIPGDATNDTSPDDSDTDYVDESAIDDENDWVDSIEDSNKSSIDEKTLFQRVDSKPNLTSRRSLITLMIDHQARTNNSAQSALATSPSDSDDSLLMMKHGNRSSSPKLTNEVPRSAAQPILARHSESCPLIPTSPRTTRRNMLATELTESLRRNLLWERQQKSSTANAVLKRRHISHDVANLKQYPEKAYMNNNEDLSIAPQYVSKDDYGGYHSKGW